MKFNKYQKCVENRFSDRSSGHFLGCAAETKHWQNHDFDTICLWKLNNVLSHFAYVLKTGLFQILLSCFTIKIIIFFVYFVGEYDEDDEADLLLKTSSNDIQGEYLDCTSLYHYETTETRKHSSNMRTACFCGSGVGRYDVTSCLVPCSFRGYCFWGGGMGMALPPWTDWQTGVKHYLSTTSFVGGKNVFAKIKNDVRLAGRFLPAANKVMRR